MPAAEYAAFYEMLLAGGPPDFAPAAFPFPPAAYFAADPAGLEMLGEAEAAVAAITAAGQPLPPPLPQQEAAGQRLVGEWDA